MKREVSKKRMEQLLRLRQSLEVKSEGILDRRVDLSLSGAPAEERKTLFSKALRVRRVRRSVEDRLKGLAVSAMDLEVEEIARQMEAEQDAIEAMILGDLAKREAYAASTRPVDWTFFRAAEVSAVASC